MALCNVRPVYSSGVVLTSERPTRGRPTDRTCSPSAKFQHQSDCTVKLLISGSTKANIPPSADNQCSQLTHQMYPRKTTTSDRNVTGNLFNASSPMNHKQKHTHTHSRLTALCPGLPGWDSIRKAKPIWILLKQETVSGSGISCASTSPLSFYRAMLCIRGTSHGPVSVRHKSVFY